MPRLHVNLASDPFINRVVPLAAVAILAFLALVLTITNLTLFAVFGGEYRTLRSKTARQQERIVKVNSEIQSRRTEIASPSVATFMGEAAFIDGILKTRAFSWSLFLTRLEDAKAYGVMIQAVNPKVDRDGRVSVTLRGAANPREELFKYENNLFRSNYFRNCTLRGEQKDPVNPWVQFDITADYAPEGYPPQALPPLPPANTPAENAPAPQAPAGQAPAPPKAAGPAKAPAPVVPPAAAPAGKIPVPAALAPTTAPGAAPAPGTPPQKAPAQVPPPQRPASPPPRPAARPPGPSVPRGTPAPTKAPPSNPGTPPANRPATTPSGGAP